MNPPSPICCADFHNELGECLKQTQQQEQPTSSSDGTDNLHQSNPNSNINHAKQRAAKRYANRIGGENDLLGGYSPQKTATSTSGRPNAAAAVTGGAGNHQVDMIKQLISDHHQSNSGKARRKKPKMAVLLFGPFGKAYDEESKVTRILTHI